MKKPRFAKICIRSAAATLFLLVLGPVPVSAATYTVTTTADAGAGSLREAITNANADGDSDTIAFAIPGAGPHTITLTSELPSVSTPMVIDGTIQSGFYGTPMIVLDGSMTSDVDGLNVTAGPTAIRGLAITEFDKRAIRVVGATAVFLQQNHLGVDANGTTAAGNGAGILISGATTVVVGSSGMGNVISGNTGDGVEITGGSANVSVQGNIIGGDVSGTSSIGNGDAGIRISASTDAVDVGSSAPNVIRGNNKGVVVLPGGYASIRRNRIFDNTSMQIDLNDDGPTSNDLNDIDGGGNGQQNFPVLDQVTFLTSGQLIVRGVINSAPLTEYEIDLYSGDTCGQAEVHLGSFIATTNTPTTRFEGTVDNVTSVPDQITVTATHPMEGTSELPSSGCIVAEQAELEVQMTGNAFVPGSVRETVSATVNFVNEDAVQHTATDQSPLHLFDSGSMNQFDAFVAGYGSVGSYPFYCAIHGLGMSGTMKIVPNLQKAHKKITVSWAELALVPGDHRFDIQVRRPGKNWRIWKDDTAQDAAVYTARDPGRYRFRGRTVNPNLGAVSAYSPPVSVKV